MAFTSSLSERTVMGDKRVNFGILAQATGDTGGTVATGLTKVDSFFCSMNADITISGGDAAIITKDFVADQDGFWMAIGY